MKGNEVSYHRKVLIAGKQASTDVGASPVETGLKQEVLNFIDSVASCVAINKCFSCLVTDDSETCMYVIDL